MAFLTVLPAVVVSSFNRLPSTRPTVRVGVDQSVISVSNSISFPCGVSMLVKVMSTSVG